MKLFLLIFKYYKKVIFSIKSLNVLNKVIWYLINIQNKILSTENKVTNKTFK